MPAPPGQTSTPSGAAPFFFGAPRSLFGMYHPPLSRADRETGVVLCGPFGREYLLAHRALRHLALRLSERGFHVLRFDYFGTGDSAGDGEEASLTGWVGDVGAAIDEIERRAGLTRVALVGLRLGGSLAWLAALDRRDVEALVLWEPIASGPAYLEEAEAQDRAWHAERSLPWGDAGGETFLGFPVPPALRTELEDLELPGDRDRRPARHLLLVRHDPPRAEDGLAKGLASWGRNAQTEHRPSPPFWQRDGDGPAVVVPGPPVQKILQWMEDTLP